MISDDDVARAAVLLGLELPAARVPRVADTLRRIEWVVERIDELELDPQTDELAPVWRP